VNDCFAQNYINYHKEINNAELKIVESDFQNSLNNYQKAFELVDKPFAKDLYNASLCSEKSKNDSLTYILVKQQLQKGIPLKFFKSKSYKHFQKSKYWKELKKEEKNLIKLFKQNVNQSYLSELKEIEKLDQRIRKRKYGYPRSDTIAQVDSLNMSKLVELINKYGYSSENIIGITNPKRTFVKPQNIVLRHFFQGQTLEKAKQNELGKILITALENGEICPIQYSVWEDIRYYAIHKKHKYGITVVIEQNKTYRRNELKNIEELDVNRRKIGIGTFDEYVSKIIFQKNQSEFFFGIDDKQAIHKF